MSLWRIITPLEFEKKFEGNGKRKKRLFLKALLRDIIHSRTFKLPGWHIESFKIFLKEIDSDWFVHDLEHATKRNFFRKIYSAIFLELVNNNYNVEFVETLNSKLKSIDIEDAINKNQTIETIFYKDFYGKVSEKYARVYNIKNANKYRHFSKITPKKEILFVNNCNEYSFGDMWKFENSFFYNNEFYRFPLFFMKKLY